MSSPSRVLFFRSISREQSEPGGRGRKLGMVSISHQWLVENVPDANWGLGGGLQRATAFGGAAPLPTTRSIWGPTPMASGKD